MTGKINEFPAYLVSIKFNDCSVEREEHETLSSIYNSLVRLPKIMDVSLECFDDAYIAIYTQPEDELVVEKRYGDLYSNFLTYLNYAIAEEMGVKL